MTVEGWQLASAALAILGAGATGARLYFGSLGRRIKEVEDRLRTAEQADVAYKEQVIALSRRFDDDARRVADSNGRLGAEVATLSRNVTGLMVAFGKVEERLDLKREIRGLVGRRHEDNPENGK